MSQFDTTGSGHIPVGGKAVLHLDEHTCHHTRGDVCPACAELTDDEVAALREYFALLKQRAAVSDSDRTEPDQPVDTRCVPCQALDFPCGDRCAAVTYVSSEEMDRMLDADGTEMSDHQGGMCGINAGRCEDCEREVRLQAVAARARGDFRAERRALDVLTLMERSHQGMNMTSPGLYQLNLLRNRTELLDELINADEDVRQCRSCDQPNDTHSIGCPMHPHYDPDLT